MTRTLFTDDELAGLLQRDEGQFLEFKFVWDREGHTPRHLARRVVRDRIAVAITCQTGYWSGHMSGMNQDMRAHIRGTFP